MITLNAFSVREKIPGVPPQEPPLTVRPLLLHNTLASPARRNPRATANRLSLLLALRRQPLASTLAALIFLGLAAMMTAAMWCSSP